MNFETLRAFSIFAETLNFTHAADRLHISQPALHVKVQELARSLNVALYVRQGRRLTLTDKGLELARFAREIEDRVADFGAEFREEKSALPVVLAAGQGAYLYLLGPSIQRYRGSLKLLTHDGESCLEAVRNGIAHLGVAALERPPEGLGSQLLAEIGSVLVVKARTRLARRDPLELSDLEGLTLVVAPAHRPHRQVLAAALQNAGVNWHVGVEAHGWELMLHFVKLGLGAAVVNSFCSLPPGLVSRPLRGLPKIRYYAFWRRGYLRPEAEQLRLCLGTTVEPGE